MTGTIYHINKQREMYSILESSGNFIVFELLGNCELSKGDTITGTILSGGGAKLRNLTTLENFDVSIERINCTEFSARQGCFLG